MKRSEVTFNELDKYTFEHFPKITDSLIGFFQKLERLFNPMYEELLQDVEEFINKNNSYIIKDRYEPAYYPFTSQRQRKIRKIKSLNDEFELRFGFFIEQKIRGTINKQFYILFSFKYHDENKDPYFCFYIENAINKSNQPIYDLGFYKKMASQLKGFNVDYYHPSEDEEEESVYISEYKLDNKQIELAFEAYKNHVVVPFFNNLK
ncbi:MAG: hypothetical protein JKX95_06445 [Bacteroidia bacterium]|nr:hypothetical protein [Bacteroidia bacterium]